MIPKSTIGGEAALTERKRIALFMPAFSGGGAERVMVTLANSFCLMDINVDLIVLKATGPYINEVGAGVRIIELDASRAMTGILSLSKYLKKNRPDVLLVTMRHTAVCAYFARQLAGMTQRTRLFVREAMPPSFDQINSGFSAKIMRLFLPTMYKNIDAVISTTPQMTLELSDKYTFNGLYTIGNPVVSDKFKELVAKVEDCSWPWVSDEKIVIAVGRLTRQKDFETLINAFALANQKLSCRLVILGEGELRSRLESLVIELDIEDRVWMPGFVENPFAFMAKSDLCVMSSLAEGLPNVLIQALCCGTPVVSTRCPTGPEDLLEGGKFGMLVDVGDTQTMARCIVESLEMDKKNMEHKAHFRKKYDVDTIAAQYMQVFF